MLEIYGHGGSGSRFRAALLLVGLAPLAACDVQWGGAMVALVNPAPQPEPSEETAPEERIEPLPSGELLYLVRTGDDGTARVLPVARMEGGVPAALELPSEMDADYRARFDSAFYAGGTELPLHAGGQRVGTLILDGTASGSTSRCPSIGGGRVLLLPGAAPPGWGFAWSGEGAGGEPAETVTGVTDNRMRTFGPVIAEALFRRGGESRPYLAQRIAMEPVPWRGDDRPAMAATYLVNDALGGDLPERAASSLFFLARFDGRQYVPEWWEVRRYGGDRPREAFVYFGSAGGPGGRFDVVTRHDGAAVRLAASADRDEREIDWVESDRCPAVPRLDESAADAAGPAGGAAGATGAAATPDTRPAGAVGG